MMSAISKLHLREAITQVLITRVPRFIRRLFILVRPARFTGLLGTRPPPWLVSSRVRNPHVMISVSHVLHRGYPHTSELVHINQTHLPETRHRGNSIIGQNPEMPSQAGDILATGHPATLAITASLRELHGDNIGSVRVLVIRSELLEKPKIVGRDLFLARGTCVHRM